MSKCLLRARARARRLGAQHIVFIPHTDSVTLMVLGLGTMVHATYEIATKFILISQVVDSPYVFDLGIISKQIANAPRELYVFDEDHCLFLRFFRVQQYDIHERPSLHHCSNFVPSFLLLGIPSSMNS